MFYEPADIDSTKIKWKFSKKSQFIFLFFFPQCVNIAPNIFSCENFLISPCFEVLRTDTHNYLWPKKNCPWQCFPVAEVIPRNRSCICLIHPSKQSAFSRYIIWTLIVFLFRIPILHPGNSRPYYIVKKIGNNIGNKYERQLYGHLGD